MGDQLAVLRVDFFHLAVCVLLMFDVGISALAIAAYLQLLCNRVLF